MKLARPRPPMTVCVPPTLWVLGALCLLIVAFAPAAQATPRFAIVIGSNQGEPDEPRLRFAERDALRMTEVLTRLGGFPAEQIATLLSPSAEDLTHALDAFRARVETSGRGALVMVYYSGHADERALHLSGSRYRFDRLKEDVRRIGAELSLFIVDACRSGGMIRAKGATPTEPFAIEVRDALTAEGTAIITSSSETEDAQESDRLAGGVFTHHLVTGLLGAADHSGDDRVSLDELYRYVYAQTIAATSTTSIVQHPTFALDVQGHDQIILTRLDERADRARLRLAERGHYLVFDRSGARGLVAELDAEPNASLWLRPGDYLVRRRESSAAYEKQVRLDAGATLTLDSDALERVPFRHAVRKGYAAHAPMLSLGVSLDAGSPLLDHAPLFGAALGLQVDFEDLALATRLRFAASGDSNARLARTTTLLGVDAALIHLFDIGDHGVGFGLRAGLDWLAQRFATKGVAAPVDQLVARVGPFVRGELALGSVLTLHLDAGLDAYLVSVAPDDGGDPKRTIEPAVILSLGFSGALP